jgi:hypothetical protein
MKTVRLRTRAGEVRFTSLTPFADLPSWWHEMKFRGGVIGNNWCLPFDEIAVADLMEISEEKQTALGPMTQEQIERFNEDQRRVARMAAGIGAGLWVPPGEKQ